MSPIFRTLAAVCSTALITVVTVGVPAAPASASTTACSGGGTLTINSNNVVTGVTGGTGCNGDVIIPKSVTSIGTAAFARNFGLTSVTFEAVSVLTTIADNAFDSSGLTSIEIPKSVTSIGFGAFFNTHRLTSVTFEADSVLTTIGISAFQSSVLTSIEIPKSVTSIGDFAFHGTSALTSVTFEGNAPSSVGTSAFLNVAQGATANIGFTATGFEPDLAGLWEGLVLVRAAAPPVPAVASGPAGPALACMPAGLPAVGALVTCTVTGGDAGIDILWRAAYNPVFAGEGMTLDASGAGTFSFVVPAAAFGQPITVELVDWTAPVSLGVSGGPVPTSVPAGGGPMPVWTLALAALAGVGLLRRGMRAQA